MLIIFSPGSSLANQILFAQAIYDAFNDIAMLIAKLYVTDRVAYVTAHSFWQLCLVIIVILAQSKLTRRRGRNTNYQQRRINGFDVV